MKKRHKYGQNLRQNTNTVTLTAIAISAGIMLRIAFFMFYSKSGDIYCDEAMTVLNARAIANSGTDIMGNAYPIYFATWLYGGQSGFATYIMAAFIKIFGFGLEITRLPILIFSVLGLCAFAGCAKLIMQNERQIFFATALAALSPHFIYQSAWTLDCAFFPQLFIIGLYFLLKAYKSRSKLCYAAAMIFFALCLYSYIAAFLIVPVFLVIFFITGMAQKRIKFGETILSVIVITLAALPIIAFGFVQTGLIGEFSIFGFTASKMQDYNRASSFNFEGGAKGFLMNVAYNIIYEAIHFFVPDTAIYRSAFGATLADAASKNGALQILYNITTPNDSISAFDFGHALSGILLLAGFITIIIKRKKLNKDFRHTVFALTATLAIFAVFVKLRSYTLYRFSAFYWLFYLVCSVAAAGLYDSIKANKKVKNTAAALLLACSVALSFYIYNDVFTANSNFFGNSFIAALEAAEKGNGNTVIFNDTADEKGSNEREAVYIYYAKYDDKAELTPLEDLLKTRGTISDFNAENAKAEQIGAKLGYETYRDGEALNADSYIFTDETLNEATAKKITGYEYCDFGYYNVLIKK